MARIIFYVFIFISGYISSRVLSPSEFGQLHYITFLINVLWMFSNLGVPNLMSRYFPKAFHHQHLPSIKLLLKYATIAFISSCIILLTAFVWIYKDSAIQLPLFPVVIFAITQLLLTFLNVFIQSVYRYRTVFWMNVIACVSGTVFLYSTISIWGSVAYLYAFVLVNLILSTGYLITLMNAIKTVPVKDDIDFSLPKFSGMLKVALYFAVSAILAGIVWQRFELSILKTYFDFAHLAVYGVAFTVIALFAEPLKLIPGVLLYYFANVEDKHEHASNQFEQFLKHFSWLVMFIGMFIWFDAEHIVSLLYTDKYLESAFYIKILMIGMIPGVCGYVMMSTHVGLGKARFLVIQDTVTAAVFLAMAFVFIHQYGLEGAAWAKTIAMLLSVVSGLLYTHFRLKYKIPVVSLSLSILLSLLLLWPFQAMFSNNWFFIIVKFAILFLVYVSVSWLLRIIDRSLFTRVLSFVKQKTN